MVESDLFFRLDICITCDVCLVFLLACHWSRLNFHPCQWHVGGFLQTWKHISCSLKKTSKSYCGGFFQCAINGSISKSSLVACWKKPSNSVKEKLHCAITGWLKFVQISIICFTAIKSVFVLINLYIWQHWNGEAKIDLIRTRQACIQTDLKCPLL